MSEQYTYILRADGYKAMPIRSSLNYNDMKEYIRVHSKKVHPEGRDVVFRWGAINFFNPVVMTVNDFSNRLPALIAVD
jgi:hypothetical protein